MGKYSRLAPKGDARMTKVPERGDRNTQTVITDDVNKTKDVNDKSQDYQDDMKSKSGADLKV